MIVMKAMYSKTFINPAMKKEKPYDFSAVSLVINVTKIIFFFSYWPFEGFSSYQVVISLDMLRLGLEPACANAPGGHHLNRTGQSSAAQASRSFRMGVAPDAED